MSNQQQQPLQSFKTGMANHLPMLDRDNRGRWFVARETPSGISIEIVETEVAGKARIEAIRKENAPEGNS